MTCRREEVRARRPATLLIAVAILAGCGEQGGRMPVELASCRRVDVIDGSGSPVVGIEDIGVDHERSRLYLSAYDRRAVDAELGGAEQPVTTGGVYVLDLSRALERQVQAESLTADPEVPLPVRPHGIHLYVSDSGARRLFVIDRQYEKSGTGWRQVPKLAVLSLADDGRRVEGVAHLTLPPEICSPNDLAASLDGVFVSNDRGACEGVERRLEDLMGLGNSFVARLTPAGMETAANRLRFANGVALVPREDGGDDLVVAATRADAVFFFPAEAERLSRRAAHTILRIGAGPDNITVGGDGALYVAVHPSIFRYAMFRGGWFGVERAPSTVFRIDRDEAGTYVARRLFHDPDGEAISGATVAAEHEGRLFLGAAYDDHLAVCAFSDEGNAA